MGKLRHPLGPPVSKKDFKEHTPSGESSKAPGGVAFGRVIADGHRQQAEQEQESTRGRGDCKAKAGRRKAGQPKGGNQVDDPGRALDSKLEGWTLIQCGVGARWLSRRWCGQSCLRENSQEVIGLCRIQ